MTKLIMAAVCTQPDDAGQEALALGLLPAAPEVRR
jgi:hypothetical protein